MAFVSLETGQAGYLVEHDAMFTPRMDCCCWFLIRRASVGAKLESFTCW